MITKFSALADEDLLCVADNPELDPDSAAHLLFESLLRVERLMHEKQQLLELLRSVLNGEDVDVEFLEAYVH